MAMEEINAQVVSVEGGAAWVLIEGDYTPVQIAMESHVTLTEGTYPVVDCDWVDETDGEPDSGGETPFSAYSVPPGGAWVTLRRKNKHSPWSIHRVNAPNGGRMQALDYTIGNIYKRRPRAKHHHERMQIRWAYITVDENVPGNVTYQVKANNSVIIQGSTTGTLSKKKKVAQVRWIGPNERLKVVLTSPAEDEEADPVGAVVTIGYTI